ncbi:MAG: FecR family protein [Burkholderiaceae bacterium]
MRLERVLVGWALVAASLGARAEPVCEVLAVRGEARVAGQALAVGQGLEVGAEIRTGAGGRVRLRFADGSVLVVADHSLLKLARYEAGPGKPREASLLLETGLIGQQVSKVPGGAWEVRTPTAVTAVRGTEFIVEVGADLATAVNVQSGQVAVEALQSAAGGGTRSLRPRSVVVLERAQAATQCSPAQGCSAAEAWPAERLKASQDRLAF